MWNLELKSSQEFIVIQIKQTFILWRYGIFFIISKTYVLNDRKKCSTMFFNLGTQSHKFLLLIVFSACGRFISLCAGWNASVNFSLLAPKWFGLACPKFFLSFGKILFMQHSFIWRCSYFATHDLYAVHWSEERIYLVRFHITFSAVKKEHAVHLQWSFPWISRFRSQCVLSARNYPPQQVFANYLFAYALGCKTPGSSSSYSSTEISPLLPQHLLPEVY